MSDIFWDDLEYKHPWRDVATHDEKNVKGFFGEYRFLSNFHVPAPVEFEGIFYPSSENAYQAAKCAPTKRYEFTSCTPKESKKLWKKVGTVYSPAEWDSIKNSIMARIVFSKFLINKDLRKQLLETGSRYLEETNWWKDIWWGADTNGVGENHLGRILMATREYFQSPHLFYA